MRGGDSAALNVPRSEVSNSPGQIIFQELNSLVMSCESPRIIILYGILRIHPSCAFPFFKVIQWYQVFEVFEFDFWIRLIFDVVFHLRPWSQEGVWRCRARAHRMPGQLERHHWGDSHDLSLLFKHFSQLFLKELKATIPSQFWSKMCSELVPGHFWLLRHPKLHWCHRSSPGPNKGWKKASPKKHHNSVSICSVWSRHLMSTRHWVQDQVMVFVNRIASVIHSCVNEFFGNPNKNIGGRLR